MKWPQRKTSGGRGKAHLKALQSVQTDAEKLQGDMDQLVITLMEKIHQELLRLHEDLQAFYNIFEFERILEIGREIDVADRAAEEAGRKIGEIFAAKDFIAILKPLIGTMGDAALDKGLERLKIATLHYKNFLLLSLLLNLIGQLREINRIGRKFAI